MNASEKAWSAVQSALNAVDSVEREKMRKFLIRRLRHPELGGNPEAGESYRVAFLALRPTSRHESPLCWCGDPRKSHDADGHCKACHCPMYMNEDAQWTT